MVLEGLVGLGVALLLGVALAEYAKFKRGAEKGWSWIALGGAWLLFAGVTQTAGISIQGLDAIIGSGGIITMLFQVVGWLFALIGAAFVAYETLLSK